MITVKSFNITIPVQRSSKSPWFWIPTLYFAEGIPYFIVNVISVTMFKRLGMSNGDLAMYTSLLYLPWVIKPLWSPFVDLIRTKRWWILGMQALCTAGFAALALSVSPDVFGLSLVIFYVIAFASATHDIAADGFYMLALDEKQQSVFVGIRSTFYRIASVFGQGVIVVLAGLLEERSGNIPRAWSITLLVCAVLFALITLWHWRFLPKVETEDRADGSMQAVFRGFLETWKTFFQKPGVWLAILFMLLYRLPEALSVKMLTPFLLDPADQGGLGLSTAQSGLVYGTVGVIALTVGGILGGLYAARKGLKESMWPMSMALALPCAVYLFLAAAQPSQLWIIYLCVALDQFGYGFGFTAYMLYMMRFSEGEFKTSHYAICTAFMALSMMLPGFFAGWMQEAVGYVGFFIIVMVCCLATVCVTFFARRRCSS
ncbi:MAG: MFS transporter [Bacteroidales bacterium]|nr:MFS transporter [Bacteroidales bacterium]